MNLRDALLAAPTHDADRMPADVDRRLRRRLGLEAAPSASTRPAWLRPALGGFAVAAVAAAVLLFVVNTDTVATSPPPTTLQGKGPPLAAAAGLVDVSEAAWNGTVTADELDVRSDSATSATVTWRDASIVAAPGTRMRVASAGLVLAQGAIEIQRTTTHPLAVDVPQGRVVIAAYRSSVTADRESVTILVNDGTAKYTDAAGQARTLVPGMPLVYPPPASAAPAPAPKRTTGRTSGAARVEPSAPDAEPAEPRPPSSTPRAGVACTFKSDCQAGQTCRKDERGQSVCMGNGLAGAACWFHSDCQSQRCVQRRCIE